MLTVGKQLPSFNLKGVVSNNLKTAFEDVTENSYSGKWKVIFFWPKDFTFICPTELIEFSKLNGEFQDRDTQILGVSTDSEFVHLAWRQTHEGLSDLAYPMLADIKRELSDDLGVLDPNEGVALRATFIVDPNNVIQHVSVNSLGVGRNPQETLRILDALQSDELCPCNWTKGDETIQVGDIETVA